ncbi:cell wall protein DAN4-like isoform X3 [Gambusia affinis]|uniref:cell wall protein DAN4-like isoform X3 n=1 Tax=Gambusia affinis TaxID=33528 RepID=UPI001CDB79CF|nr:cell wall protein DAN4-like isoform X3 [Gambusia affinis]
MASCCLLLFFVFLSLISLSEEACYDHFSKDKWNGKNMTDLITLINSTSPEEILKCTIWKNQNQELFEHIIQCFEGDNLEKMCDHTTGGNHKIYMFHFRCLFAKLRGINYENKHEKEIFEDCQNFSSEIKTLEWLWSNSDGTSAGAPSTSPPTTTTLTPTTTSTICTPSTSTSRKTTSLTTSSTTTSTSSSTTTSTTSSPTSSMSPRTTMSTTTTLKSLSRTTSTRSPTSTSTSGRTTTLTASPPTTSALTPTTTSTISTPTKSTSRNTTSLTTSSTTTSTSPTTTTSTTSSPTSSMSPTTTTSTTSSPTSSMSPRTTASTRSLTTTSRSSLTTRSTAKGQTQWSNTTTRRSPMTVKPCLACHCESGPSMGWRTGSTTETSAPLTGQTASILVALILSIIGNLMQGLNSFLQKRRLKKQKEMSVEHISLNADATAAEESPEKSLGYSNDTVL